MNHEGKCMHVLWAQSSGRKCEAETGYICSTCSQRRSRTNDSHLHPRLFQPVVGAFDSQSLAMRIWRRSFASSVIAGLDQTAHQCRRVRCAQVLQATQPDGTSSYEDRQVTLQGFIRSVRKQKRYAFAEISDGSTVRPLQAILNPSQASECVSGGGNACLAQILFRGWMC